tara:strand:+ start:552 stop:788 length:237 start_codon:yes stop_codon:yes gene_type:complete
MIEYSKIESNLDKSSSPKILEMTKGKEKGLEGETEMNVREEKIQFEYRVTPSQLIKSNPPTHPHIHTNERNKQERKST